jgi:hypothetical protein
MIADVIAIHGLSWHIQKATGRFPVPRGIVARCVRSCIYKAFHRKQRYCLKGFSTTWHYLGPLLMSGAERSPCQLPKWLPFAD